ncbi:MAG: UbiA family prenyltransferase [Candidatus Micrarchaeia archaeon]
MSFIKEFLKLTRFEHALMLSFAVLIAEIIVLGSFPQITFIILASLLVPILSEMGSFALNDYLDIETDKLNKRNERPLVKGTISPEFAFYFSWLCFILSVFIAYFINFWAFLIALIFSLLAILYNYKLKDLPFLGNIYIGLSMAIPLIFGNLVVSNQLDNSIILLSVLAFLSGVGREIIKSVQDMPGDKIARNSKTYPILVGKRKALLTAGIFYLFFVFVALYLSFEIQNVFAKYLIIFVAAFFIYQSVFLFIGKSDDLFLEKSRKLSLIFLFLGLVSILINVLF